MKDFAEYSQTVSGIFQDSQIQFLAGGRQKFGYLQKECLPNGMERRGQDRWNSQESIGMS